MLRHNWLLADLISSNRRTIYVDTWDFHAKTAYLSEPFCLPASCFALADAIGFGGRPGERILGSRLSGLAQVVDATRTCSLTDCSDGADCFGPVQGQGAVLYKSPPALDPWAQWASTAPRKWCNSLTP